MHGKKKKWVAPLGCFSESSHLSYLTSLQRGNDGNTITHSRQQFHGFHCHSTNHPERSPWRHTKKQMEVLLRPLRMLCFQAWYTTVSTSIFGLTKWAMSYWPLMHGTFWITHIHSESIESAEALSQLHCHQSWGIIQITNKPKGWTPASACVCGCVCMCL